MGEEEDSVGAPSDPGIIAVPCEGEDDPYIITFWCQGCRSTHSVTAVYKKTAFYPVVRAWNPRDTSKARAWWNDLRWTWRYSKGGGISISPSYSSGFGKKDRCHLFLDGSVISYLDDSTHELRGRKVKLSPIYEAIEEHARLSADRRSPCE